MPTLIITISWPLVVLIIALFILLIAAVILLPLYKRRRRSRDRAQEMERRQIQWMDKVTEVEISETPATEPPEPGESPLAADMQPNSFENSLDTQPGEPEPHPSELFRFCPYCGTSLDRSYRFCFSCGREMPELSGNK